MPTEDAIAVDQLADNLHRRLGWLLVAGAVVVVGLAFCASYLAFDSLRSVETRDAAQVRSLTDEITAIVIPAPLMPQRANTRGMVGGSKQVRYYAKDSGILTLTEFPEPKFRLGMFKQTSIDDVLNRVKPYKGQGGISTVEEIQPWVNGEQAFFTIGTIKGDNGWQVAGKFQGPRGPVLLEMTVSAPTFSKRKIHEMIHSIRPATKR
jgi:hypothetical protein